MLYGQNSVTLGWTLGSTLDPLALKGPQNTLQEGITVAQVVPTLDAIDPLAQGDPLAQEDPVDLEARGGQENQNDP